MPAEISIIIPCYRVEVYIERAIRSLIAQTYSHWQAVVVSDDGVDYLALLADLGIVDYRITQVFTDGVGTGVSHARNVGLRVCKTDYIATLDPDDVFAPNRLAGIVPLLAEHPLVMTGYINIDDATQQIIPTQKLFAGNQEVFIKDSPKIMMNYAASYAFNRQFIRHFWYENIRQAEDHLWALLAYDSVKSIYYFAEASYFYYKREGSLVNSPDAPQRFQQTKQKIVEDIKSGLISIAQPQVREHILKIYAISLAVEKEYEQALEHNKDVAFGDISMAHFTRAGMV